MITFTYKINSFFSASINDIEINDELEYNLIVNITEYLDILFEKEISDKETKIIEVLMFLYGEVNSIKDKVLLTESLKKIIDNNSEELKEIFLKNDFRKSDLFNFFFSKIGLYKFIDKNKS